MSDSAKQTNANGLWIDVEFCTGCFACEAACRQEHDLGPTEYGIKVVEQVLNDGQTFNCVPIPTDICDLCVKRVHQERKRPACVHHCMAQVMEYGPLDSLLELMKRRPRSVIWSPKPRPRKRPYDDVKEQMRSVRTL